MLCGLGNTEASLVIIAAVVGWVAFLVALGVLIGYMTGRMGEKGP